LTTASCTRSIAAAAPNTEDHVDKVDVGDMGLETGFYDGPSEDESEEEEENMEEDSTEKTPAQVKKKSRQPSKSPGFFTASASNTDSPHNMEEEL
jgi:hypothetical protein